MFYPGQQFFGWEIITSTFTSSHQSPLNQSIALVDDSYQKICNILSDIKMVENGIPTNYVPYNK